MISIEIILKENKMYSHLDSKPETKQDYRRIEKHWQEALQSSEFDRNPNENGYERDNRIAKRKVLEDALESWRNRYDYSFLPN